jgi:hypothetical protein
MQTKEASLDFWLPFCQEKGKRLPPMRRKKKSQTKTSQYVKFPAYAKMTDGVERICRANNKIAIV